MANRTELVSGYRERLVNDLGVWAEDPRSIASVNARADRAQETMAHMDRPLPQEARASEMKPGEAYKL